MYFSQGRIFFELAQESSCVALALYKAGSSSPFGVTVCSQSSSSPLINSGSCPLSSVLHSALLLRLLPSWPAPLRSSWFPLCCLVLSSATLFCPVLLLLCPLLLCCALCCCVFCHIVLSSATLVVPSSFVLCLLLLSLLPYCSVHCYSCCVLVSCVVASVILVCRLLFLTFLFTFLQELDFAAPREHHCRITAFTS